MLKSYRMSFDVVLEGFTYDDVHRIAKDFGLTTHEVMGIYRKSRSAEEFERLFAGIAR